MANRTHQTCRTLRPDGAMGLLAYRGTGGASTVESGPTSRKRQRLKRFLGVLLAAESWARRPRCPGRRPRGRDRDGARTAASSSPGSPRRARPGTTSTGEAATAVNTPLIRASPLPPSDVGCRRPSPTSAPPTARRTTTPCGRCVSGVESAQLARRQATPPRRARARARTPSCRRTASRATADWNVPRLHAGRRRLRHRARASTTASRSTSRSTSTAHDGRHRDLPQRLLRRRRRAALLDAPGRAGRARSPAASNDPSLGPASTARTGRSAQTITTTARWPSGVYLLRVDARTTPATTPTSCSSCATTRASAEVLYGVAVHHLPGLQQLRRQVALRRQVDRRRTRSAGTPRAVKVSFDRPYSSRTTAIQHDWYTRTDYAIGRLARALGLRRLLRRRTPTSSATARASTTTASSSRARTTSTTRRPCATALEQARDARRRPVLHRRQRGLLEDPLRAEPGVGRPGPRAWSATRSTQSGPADPSGIPTGTWRDPAGANKPENALTGGHVRRPEGLRLLPAARDRRRRARTASGATRASRHQATGTLHERSAPTSSAGSGTRASPTGTSRRRDDARGLAGAPATSSRTRAASTRPASAIGARDQVHGGRAARSSCDTGTNHWNWGLALNADGEGEPDRRIQQATTNILADMGALPGDAGRRHRARRPERAAAASRSARPRRTRPTSIRPRRSEPTFSRADGRRPRSPRSSFTLDAARRHAPSPATVAYDDTTFTATLTPSSRARARDTTYTARLDGTIRAANGDRARRRRSAGASRRGRPTRTPRRSSITAPADGADRDGAAHVTANAADNDGRRRRAVQARRQQPRRARTRPRRTRCAGTPRA